MSNENDPGAASRPRVFVSRGIPQVGIDRLAEHCEVDVWPGQLPPSRAELLERIAGCAGVLTLLGEMVDDEFLDHAGPGLRVISNYAVGYNNIDVAAAASRGVRVGNTPDVLTDATADMALCLILAAARHLKAGMDAVRDGGWATWEPLGYLGMDLAGKTVGIVGAGRIGAATAQRLHGGWGMRIQYHSRRPKPRLDVAMEARQVDLETLLSTSDIVSVHCDLNPETRGMFDRDAFARMKPGSIFVNTARGGVVDQDALVWALREGPLMAAGLDVTDPEPLSPDHPLVSLPNCTIAPHIGSATAAAREAMAVIAAENILGAIAGGPMRAEVHAS